MKRKNDTSASPSKKAKLNTPVSKIELSTYLQACIDNNLEIMNMVLSQKNSFTCGYWAVTNYYSKNTIEKILAPWDWETAFIELNPHKIVIQDPEFTKYLIANLDVHSLFDMLGNYRYIDRKNLFMQLWEKGILNLSTPNLAALIKNPAINFADVIYQQCKEESLMDTELCNFLLAHISFEDMNKIVTAFGIPFPNEDETQDSLDDQSSPEDEFSSAWTIRFKKMVFDHPKWAGLNLFMYMKEHFTYDLDASFIHLYYNNILVLNDTARNLIEADDLLDCSRIIRAFIQDNILKPSIELQTLLLKNAEPNDLDDIFRDYYIDKNEYPINTLDILIPYMSDFIGYVIHLSNTGTSLEKLKPLMPYVADTLKRSLADQTEPDVESEDMARYRAFLQEISQNITDDETKKRVQVMTFGLPGLQDAKNKFLFFPAASTLLPELWSKVIGKAIVDSEVYPALKK